MRPMAFVVRVGLATLVMACTQNNVPPQGSDDAGNNTTQCGQASCNGCCAAGECQAGNTAAACGVGGGACSVCAGATPQCEAGSCVGTGCGREDEPCGSGCCPGLYCVVTNGVARCGEASCGARGNVCCTGVGMAPCGAGLACESGVCVSAFGDLGRTCTANMDCDQDLCLPLGNGTNVCTRPCTGAAACLTGWSCAPLSGVPSNVCQCVPSEEECNGEDDDCNGFVDDGAAANSCTRPGTECRAGSCQCAAPLEDCNGTCANLMSSDENCGMCGRGCTAAGEDMAQCVESQCKTATHLWGLYAHVKEMVPFGDGFIMAQEAVNGSPPPATVQGYNFNTGAPTFTVSTTSPRRLATNGMDVFFTNDDGVQRINRTAETAELVVAVPNQRAVAVAASATHLYWSVNLVPYELSQVWRCSLPACSDAAEIGHGDPVFEMVLEGDNLFWFTEMQTDGGWETHLRRCAVTGCPGGPTTVFIGDRLRSLRVFGGRFYFADGISNGIRACMVPDCSSPVTVVPNASVYDLQVDSMGVYWTTGSIGSGIAMCPPTGCTTPRTLFGGGIEDPLSLVLGPGHLAFSSEFDLFLLPR